MKHHTALKMNYSCIYKLGQKINHGSIYKVWCHLYKNEKQDKLKGILFSHTSIDEASLVA